MRRKFHAHPDPNFGARIRPRVQVDFEPRKRSINLPKIDAVLAALIVAIALIAFIVRLITT